MGSKYSEAEKRTLCDTINKYLNDGYTDIDISDKVGVSARTIYSWRMEGAVRSASRSKSGKHVKAIDMKDLKSKIAPFERMDGTPIPYKEEPETDIPFADNDAFADDCKDYCELEPQQKKAKAIPILKREVKISGDYIEVTEKNGNFEMKLLGSVESDGKGGLMDVLNQVIAECQGMMAELED